MKINEKILSLSLSLFSLYVNIPCLKIYIYT